MPNKPVQRARQAVCGLAVMILILIPEVAQVSITHVVAVTLDELIERSSHIVITEPDSPPFTTEDVPVEQDGKTYEPYRRLVHRLRVQESLRGDLKPGAVIQMVAANDSQLEHMHRLYVTAGTTKSFYDDQYEPQAEIAPDAPLIHFVRRHVQGGNRYSYVAGNSFDGMGMKNEIERRLRQISP